MSQEARCSKGTYSGMSSTSFRLSLVGERGPDRDNLAEQRIASGWSTGRRHRSWPTAGPDAPQEQGIDTHRRRGSREVRRIFAGGRRTGFPGRWAAAGWGGVGSTRDSPGRACAAGCGSPRPACCSRSWRRAPSAGSPRLALGQLADNLAHVPGRHELRLLDVHRLPVAPRPPAGRSAAPGTPGSAGRPRPPPPAPPAHASWISVSTGTPSRSRTAARISSPRLQPRTAVGAQRRPVRLVEATP